MHRVSQLLLPLVGMLLSAACLADDAESPAATKAALPEVTLSAQAMYDQWDNASRWQLSHPVETMAYTTDGSRPGVDVDFRDSGALARVSRLRSLSLLTFAEIGRARLFLGVDDNGIVGLHVRAFHRLDDERYLEVVRMPYLEKNLPINESK